MTRDQITEAVLSAIAAVKRIPRESITLDSSFESLGLDSLDAINVMFEIEDKLSVSIPDEEVRSLKNVRGIVDGLERLTAAQAGTPAETAG